ncbi:MAG: PAT family beta-lactamase induction signal transducer AmpG, partial [Enterobacterales bacterium]
MITTFTLIDSPRVRYITGAMMYFAQGIPAGLLSIAIPTWMASQGVSAADIGSYLAVIILPWVFKLVTGPLMDRFGYPSMGRRRPWVLAAQLGLSVSLLSLMTIDDPAQQITQLMMIGVFINIFAATQDVAVDGMSIDLTPVNEQGRLNAFMSFGKSAGWALTAAASGLLLVNFGMQVTAIVAALASAIIFFAFITVQERKGERKLPWSKGEATSSQKASSSFSSVFSGINSVLWKRTSLFIMLIMLIDGFISGYGWVLMPIAAVKVFGFSTPEWTQTVAVMGIVGAVITLLMGPMVDRFGPKKMMLVTAILVAIHALLLAQTQFMWSNTFYVKAMLSVWVMMQPVTMVCVIALGMTICS